jgi:hypothetical protein
VYGKTGRQGKLSRVFDAEAHQYFQRPSEGSSKRRPALLRQGEETRGEDIGRKPGRKTGKHIYEKIEAIPLASPLVNTDQGP